jgi:hypothetical protein
MLQVLMNDIRAGLAVHGIRRWRLSSADSDGSRSACLDSLRKAQSSSRLDTSHPDLADEFIDTSSSLRSAEKLRGMA